MKNPMSQVYKNAFFRSKIGIPTIFGLRDPVIQIAEICYLYRRTRHESQPKYLRLPSNKPYCNPIPWRKTSYTSILFDKYYPHTVKLSAVSRDDLSRRLVFNWTHSHS